MRENYKFAMSRASRFLDTTLKVSELAHREHIYENEIDALVIIEENEANANEVYDSLKKTDEDESNMS